MSLHLHTPFPPNLEDCAGVKRSGWEMGSRVFQVPLLPTHQIHSFPLNDCREGRGGTSPVLSCSITSASCESGGLALPGP